MLRSTVTRKMSADRDSRRRIEVANLESGRGGAENESLWEAPPRQPSSVPALRNASLQRHAEDEEKQQQPRQFHGVYLAYFSLPLSPPLEQKTERNRELVQGKNRPVEGGLCSVLCQAAGNCIYSIASVMDYGSMH